MATWFSAPIGYNLKASRTKRTVQRQSDVRCRYRSISNPSIRQCCSGSSQTYLGFIRAVPVKVLSSHVFTASASIFSIAVATMKSWKVALLPALANTRLTVALDNGVGLKPHMGWSSWVPTSPFLYAYRVLTLLVECRSMQRSLSQVCPRNGRQVHFSWTQGPWV